MIYKLNLSNKESITISEEEFIKFKENISAHFIEFESGIVNPSFVISIIADEQESIYHNSDRISLMDRKNTPPADIEKLRAVIGKKDIKSIKEASRLIGENVSKL